MLKDERSSADVPNWNSCQDSVYSSGANTKLGALHKVPLSSRSSLLIVHAAVPGVLSAYPLNSADFSELTVQASLCRRCRFSVSCRPTCCQPYVCAFVCPLMSLKLKHSLSVCCCNSMLFIVEHKNQCFVL